MRIVAFPDKGQPTHLALEVQNSMLAIKKRPSKMLFVSGAATARNLDLIAILNQMVISRCGAKSAIYIAGMNLTDLNLDVDHPSPASMDASTDTTAHRQDSSRHLGGMDPSIADHGIATDPPAANVSPLVDANVEWNAGIEADDASAPTCENTTETEHTTETLPEPDAGVFEHPRLSPAVRQAIVESGYQTPSPIQAAIIPPMLDGKDVIAQSQTGSGKTAAFGLPLLSSLRPTSKGKKKRRKNKPPVQALVLTPTRELAQQVASSLERYAGTERPP